MNIINHKGGDILYSAFHNLHVFDKEKGLQYINCEIILFPITIDILILQGMGNNGTDTMFQFIL